MVVIINVDDQLTRDWNISDSRIHLQPVELSLLNEYYKDFEMDSDIYMDMSLFHEYQYSAEKVVAYYNKLK